MVLDEVPLFIEQDGNLVSPPLLSDNKIPLTLSLDYHGCHFSNRVTAFLPRTF